VIKVVGEKKRKGKHAIHRTQNGNMYETVKNIWVSFSLRQNPYFLGHHKMSENTSMNRIKPQYKTRSLVLIASHNYLWP